MISRLFMVAKKRKKKTTFQVEREVERKAHTHKKEKKATRIKEKPVKKEEWKYSDDVKCLNVTLSKLSQTCIYNNSHGNHPT